MPTPTPTTVRPTNTADFNGSAPRLWWPGLGFAVAGAAIATIVALVAHAAGASLKAGGSAIPALAFAQLGFLFSLLGVVIAAVCRRFAGEPVRAFLWVTLSLLALSVLPDLLMSKIEPGTRVALVVSHLAVASVVIPGLRSRLR